MFEPYPSPRCTPANLDLFILRSAILQALRETLPRFSGRLLDVGCGYMPYKALVLSAPSRAEMYIGLDISSDEYLSRDVEWDGFTMPFATDSVGSAMATEVLEHCANPEILLREVQRVLRPGGILFFTTPFLWPLHNVPHDEYRYTPFALERHLRKAGFAQIELRALGGWDASLAQMVGLWARRRPMSRYGRFVWSRLLLPVVGLLLRGDQPPTEFASNSMMIGLWGTVTKSP